MRTCHHDCTAELHRRRICMGRGKLIYQEDLQKQPMKPLFFNKHAAIRGVLLRFVKIKP